MIILDRRQSAIQRWIIFAGLSLHSVTQAVDQSNIAQGRPLRVEDAYAIAHKEWTLQSGIRYLRSVNRQKSFTLQMEALYGVLPNTQLALESAMLLDSDRASQKDEPVSVGVHILYNLNQETLTMPALSLKLGFERPQDSSDRVKYGILLIGTSSVDSLSFHLNLAYDHYLKTARQEAEGAVKYAFALSYPVGGPLHARTLFILNYYLNESPVQGEANLQGMEAGLRYQWRERSVLDAGMGSEFAGPGGRSQFSASLGASYAF